MDIERAKELIDQGSVTIIDIRDPQSYAEAHIKNAISISDQNIEAFLRDANKESPLICYCYHGITSLSAATFFEENGFKTVHSIDGGFEEWRTLYPFASGNE